MNEVTSSLAPAGPAAESIAELWWIMVAVLGSYFVIVMLLLWRATRTRPKGQPRPPLGDERFILLGGVGIPAIIVIGLLVSTVVLTNKLWTQSPDLTVKLTGYMWWWDVQYPDHGITLANEIYIPVGKKVRVDLFSNDVIHSLWVPSLSGKTDLIPGIKTEHWLEANKPGRYRGQCAEYCGLQHARMSIYVVAVSEPEFDAWIQERKLARTIPEQPALQRGLATFKEVGCSQCHTIRGATSAVSIGPDLTHIGSRLSLGAGTVPNNFGNLAGWITHPQALKPGNHMPSTYVEPHRLNDLVAYLMSLK